MKVHSKFSCVCEHNNQCNQCNDCIINQTLIEFLPTILNGKKKQKKKFVESVYQKILIIFLFHEHPSGFLSLDWFMDLFIKKRFEHDDCHVPRVFSMKLFKKKSVAEFLSMRFFEKLFLEMYSRDEIDDFLESISEKMLSLRNKQMNIRDLNNPFILINQQYRHFLTRESQILKFQLVMKLRGTIQKDIVKKIMVSVYPEWHLNMSAGEYNNLLIDSV